MHTLTTHDDAVWLEFTGSDYAAMTRLQERLHARRRAGLIPDVVLLVEHTPCFTVGRSGGYGNLLVGPDVLKRHGIGVHDTCRGGNITYHGPGQVVCYPILSLEGAERDLHAYAHRMEEVMIRTVGAYGIAAGRKPEFPGVWVGEDKIGAMGIAVRKWTTMHGVALNVCPNLEHFSFIVPCGITGHGVTSMARLLGRNPGVATVRREMRRCFAAVFDIPLRPGRLENLLEERCHAEA